MLKKIINILSCAAWCKTAKDHQSVFTPSFHEDEFIGYESFHLDDGDASPQTGSEERKKS
ncbi:MAG: hypothetical protein ACM34I_11845 [bacterium]